MIKPHELRIGNYLQSDSSCGNEPDKCRVTTIAAYYVSMASGFSFTYNNLQPVPLSEGWLLKMGFEKSADTGKFSKSDLIINTTADDKFTWDTSQKVITLYFVHQLQNLYFALTGEELRIIQ